MSIFLKKAGFADIIFLWRLRNQPQVCQYSRQARPVALIEHLKWFFKKDPCRHLYVIQDSARAVGQLRLDFLSPEQAEVSISVSKKFCGKKIATQALNILINDLRRQNRPRQLIAIINLNNTASVELFRKLNFNFNRQNQVWLEYLLNL